MKKEKKILNVNGVDIESPCEGVCVVDDQYGWCLGCGRDLHETSHWYEMDDRERNDIKLRIPRRMKKLLEAKRDWESRNRG